MSWWTLTYFDNDRDLNSLLVLARTNHPAHLMMAWSTTKPARQPVYRWVRGKRVFCGYKYIWDTPNLTEQNQSLDTFEHIFGPIALQPTDHVWYVLSSTAKLYERYCQSPLIHVPPPEVQMASARIFHSIDQPIPGMIATPVAFDSVLWDNYNFYDPAQPTRLTVPIGGLYQFGASTHWLVGVNTGLRIRLCLNATLQLAGQSHWCNNPVWADWDLSVQTLYRLQPGDFVQVLAYNSHAAARTLEAMPNYSPHFWIRLVGPYPL